MREIDGEGSWMANMYGEHAFLDGLKRSDCPYKIGTMEHACWNVGFDEKEAVYRQRAEANEFRTKPFTVHYVEALTPDLAAAIDRAQAAITKNLNTELYGDAWYLQPHKPKPWLYRNVIWLRRRVGEKIADFASFIAGYDVRGDW